MFHLRAAAVFLGPLAVAALSAQDTAIRSGGSLLHAATVDYPREALARGISGEVVLEVDVNERGEVWDARVVSGPEELRRASLRSVLEWHYAKDVALPARLPAVIEFRLPAGAIPPAPAPVSGAGGGVFRVGGGLSAPQWVPQVVQGIRFPGLSDILRQTLQSRLPVREGDTLTAELMAQVRQAVVEVDEHLSTTLRPVDEGLELVIHLGSPTPPQRIRVGGNVQKAMLLESRAPQYPMEAKQARIQGEVRLAATIGREGRVERIEALSGHPLLVPAALEAVRQWVYKPTLMNGQPVEVMTQIEVNFTLP
jgi:TonB family protein